MSSLFVSNNAGWAATTSLLSQTAQGRAAMASAPSPDGSFTPTGQSSTERFRNLALAGRYQTLSTMSGLPNVAGGSLGASKQSQAQVPGRDADFGSSSL
jgi:hypothetical protein